MYFLHRVRAHRRLLLGVFSSESLEASVLERAKQVLSIRYAESDSESGLA